MSRFVKGAAIFTAGAAGGFVLCGVCVARAAWKSETIRDMSLSWLKKKIADGVYQFLRGDKPGKASKTYTRGAFKERNSITLDEIDDVVFDTRSDAENVLDAIRGIVEDYGFVSIADFFDLSDINYNNYKFDLFGWENIPKDCKVTRVPDRCFYKLELPKPVRLKK